MSKTSKTRYEVRFTITVDRPELRGPSFMPVAPGTKIQTTLRPTTLGAAKRIADAILRGEDDFSSEFVSSIQVLQFCASGQTRNIVPWTKRERVETGKERQRALVAVQAARRGNVLSYHHVSCIAEAA